MKLRNEKILVVDDDPSIRRLIWKSLQATGLLIYQSESIAQTIDIMTRVNFQLILLDISLENENDGYHLAQYIREQQPLIPIIFISSKKDEADIVTGLEAGGDFYISKPFSPKVLKAQVINTLERTQQLINSQTLEQKEIIQAGIFTFDTHQYLFKKNDVLIPMTSKEILVMRFFMENPYQVFSKEQIFASVWNEGDYDSQLITVYMNYLRNKIEDDPKKPKFLQTVWGLGYTFHPE